MYRVKCDLIVHYARARLREISAVSTQVSDAAMKKNDDNGFISLNVSGDDLSIR